MSDDLLATRRFKVLEVKWTSEELGRFLWLTPEDMLQVRTCRRRQGHSSDIWLNVVHGTLSAVLLRLSVVNFVGGPNRPFPASGPVRNCMNTELDGSFTPSIDPPKKLLTQKLRKILIRLVNLPLTHEFS